MGRRRQRGLTAMTRGWRRLRAAGLLIAVTAVGCATVPQEPIEPHASATQSCVALFERLDREVTVAAVADAGSQRIDDFPWLRIDRPLASFRDEVGTDDRFAAWLRQLAILDAEARAHELTNLPQDAYTRLEGHWEPAARSHGMSPDIDEALPACRELLNRDLQADDSARERLREAAIAADAYATWMRVVGVYPVARLFARPQVTALHERLEELIEAGPDTDDLRQYAVPRDRFADAARDPRRVARDIQRDALEIPVPTAEERGILFDAHAPVWRIETRSEADHPGALLLDADARTFVDTNQPVEYRHISWTRIDELVVPQLNYTVWFPERPSQGWFDPYAGHLDAVTWRVTLGPDGRVLAQDSIHACGCYYTLLPGPGWRAIADVPRREEPVFAPLAAVEAEAGERVRITLEGGRHYLLGVDTVAEEIEGTRGLAPLPNDHLRSLPLPGGGHASVYDDTGLIPSTSRPERFFLWPLGVRDAGAMRQPGHHAIAFIGRRHFDDPRLLERLLERDTPE